MSLAHLTSLEQQALQQFKTSVLHACADMEISFTVFGSRARAEGDADSDIDVLVVMTPYSDERKRAIWTAAYEVMLTTDMLISPLVLSRDPFAGLRQRERRIALDIERDGAPL